MTCTKCKGQHAIYTKVMRDFGDGDVREYESAQRCDHCGGSGVEPRLIVPMAAPEVVEPARANNPDGKDLRAEAAAWIERNPAVIEVFLRMARQKAARGKMFGIGQLTEVVRWECDDPSKYGDDYKINNNHRAYIARHLIALDPSIERYITFRETRW